MPVIVSTEVIEELEEQVEEVLRLTELPAARKLLLGILMLAIGMGREE